MFSVFFPMALSSRYGKLVFNKQMQLMAFVGKSSGFGNTGCIYGGVLWGNWGIALQDDMTHCQADCPRPFVCIPELRPHSIT